MKHSLLTQNCVNNTWTEVLEKVKGLLLLPGMEVATTQQVADFYEILPSTLRTLVKENKEELISDGYYSQTGKELKAVLGSPTSGHSGIVSKPGYFLILPEESNIRLSHNTNALFPKRAILRVGMLLRDSEVAKEVRTQLLNIEEKATTEVKTIDLKEELALQVAVGAAIMKGDVIAVATATADLVAFQKRYHAAEIAEKDTKITEQRAVIKTLAKEEVEFKTPEKLLIALLRRYAYFVYDRFDTGREWSDLCYHLLNKLDTGINLKSRKTRALKTGEKKVTFLSVIGQEEFKIVIPAIIGMCEHKGIDVSDILIDA